MASVRPRDRPVWTSLGAILALGLALRVVAAVAAEAYARRVGKPCLFGDTAIYLALARAIVAGEPYQVGQSGIPHYALRTPGYPLFLAGCRIVFGDRTLPVRLVQAALGTVGVYLLDRLVRRVVPRPGVARGAALLGAIEPYGVGLGVLLLSEGVFIPLMLAGLWGVASLWAGDDPGPRRPAVVAGLTGLAQGAAILVRPSWALFVPIALGLWVVGSPRGGRIRAARLAGVVALATAATMTPWWARNARVFGRFVPTAVWVGASLYDGLSPGATGASEMGFLAEPGIVELGEEEQDIELRRRAIGFATAAPGRAARLAAVKAGRFWSPWPNAETLRSPIAAVASAAVTIPLFGLMAAGAWRLRRDFRGLTLLAGPIVYFLLLHMIFVSSIRYRIPGSIPALGLASAAIASARPGRRKGDRDA